LDFSGSISNYKELVMRAISRLQLLRLAIGVGIGVLTFGATIPSAHAEDRTAFSESLSVAPTSGPSLRSLSTITTNAYRYNIVRESFGDDIELFFRYPTNAKSASFTAPAGLAASAARVTKQFGGLSFKPVRKGNVWEFKAVFGYKARLAFGGGYAPLRASDDEAKSMARTFSVKYTL
jgi:hypothetical protein